MALTLSDLQKRFKAIGKVIHLSQQAALDNAAYRRAYVLTDRQVMTGEDEDFDDFQELLMPLNTNVNNILSKLEFFPGQAKQMLSSYLTRVIAVDLGMSINSPLASVGAALVGRLTAVSGTVPPSGTNGSNSTGFCVYFASNFGIVLPQSVSANIPDEYITDDLV